eukprot:TRINITY_DN7851_c0_g1_i8.p1 TRINITY_DN7851_c0_g1~~TRINITY_DN7851_c0_g1_i8.p1  ORF type:complete len:115 (+),score=37.90 TRINITY_DN7851_c0_g1_i8:32-376(+)
MQMLLILLSVAQSCDLSSEETCDRDNSLCQEYKEASTHLRQAWQATREKGEELYEELNAIQSKYTEKSGRQLFTKVKNTFKTIQTDVLEHMDWLKVTSDKISAKLHKYINRLMA